MVAAKKLMSVRRDWRERDVRVVLSALIIAVATVADHCPVRQPVATHTSDFCQFVPGGRPATRVRKWQACA